MKHLVAQMPGVIPSRNGVEHFRALFEEAPIAYHEIDTDGTVVRVNQAECDLLGFTASEMVGQPVWKFVAPEEQEKSRAAVARKIHGNEPLCPYERRYARRDGSTLIAQFHERRIQDDDGTVIGMRTAMLDITEAKQAQQALHGCLETLRTVCAGALDAIVMIDGSGCVTLWNPAAEQMFGYTASEVMGQPLHALVAPAGLRAAFHTNFPLFQNTGQGAAVGKTVELTALRRDGSEFPIELALNAVIKEEQWQAVGVIRDISERKRTAEALHRRTEELARSNQELEQFAYVASHDLQEPLRMVASYTQLLARRYKGKLGADADDFIAFAVDGAKRMQHLIDDLLAYSRVGTRRHDLRTTSSDAALASALQNLSAAIEESGAVISADALPPVCADPGQLVQVFQNLLGNAIKFRKTTAPHIEVACQESSDEWRFSVSDDGIGIDPKHADRIFQVFQRLHKKEVYAGTGIGLAICKKIAERHGGRIWVESQPGQGAAFHFTIRKNLGDRA